MEENIITHEEYVQLSILNMKVGDLEKSINDLRASLEAMQNEFMIRQQRLAIISNEFQKAQEDLNTFLHNIMSPFGFQDKIISIQEEEPHVVTLVK